MLGCAGWPAGSADKPQRGVRILTETAVPNAREILASARRDVGRMSFVVEGGGRRAPADVDVRLEGVRDLAVPRSLSDDLVYKDPNEAKVVDDPRSAIKPLWRVDEATVVAADLAYEVKESRPTDLREEGSLTPARLQALADYEVVGTFLDTYTGFKAIALEKRRAAPGQAHRIYAIAGTQVFVNTDFRDWASGMTMARAHMVSTAALRLIADAAAYASDRERGGEVFITGQSQGAVTTQGVGFLLQEYLDATAASHHLVHVVSWGAAGALQPIMTLLERARAGEGRDFPPAFERHWASVDPDYRRAMTVWNTIVPVWRRLDAAALEPHIRAVAGEMRVVGYFFKIDPFARAGTFLGTSLVLPTAFVLPDDCEQLVTELMFQTRAGKLGVTLESHFLKGYQRAVDRGALAVARPAGSQKWQWLMDLLPTGDVAGMIWLNEIYRDQVLSSDDNWRLCEHARSWRTDRNRDCRQGYWPGCSRDGFADGGEAAAVVDAARWCLITDVPAMAAAAGSSEGPRARDHGR